VIARSGLSSAGGHRRDDFEHRPGEGFSRDKRQSARRQWYRHRACNIKEAGRREAGRYGVDPTPVAFGMVAEYAFGTDSQPGGRAEGHG
jgi:hypothetical protein